MKKKKKIEELIQLPCPHCGKIVLIDIEFPTLKEIHEKKEKKS